MKNVLKIVSILFFSALMFHSISAEAKVSFIVSKELGALPSDSGTDCRIRGYTQKCDSFNQYGEGTSCSDSTGVYYKSCSYR